MEGRRQGGREGEGEGRLRGEWRGEERKGEEKGRGQRGDMHKQSLGNLEHCGSCCSDTGHAACTETAARPRLPKRRKPLPFATGFHKPQPKIFEADTRHRLFCGRQDGDVRRPKRLLLR